jgi:hypothetical protein
MRLLRTDLRPRRRRASASLLAIMAISMGFHPAVAQTGTAASSAPTSSSSPDAQAEMTRRIRALEAEVAALRDELDRLMSAPRGAPVTPAAPADATAIASLQKQLEALSREIERLRIGAAATPEAAESVGGMGPAASKVYGVRRGVSIGGYGEAIYIDPSGRRDDGSPSNETASADLQRAVLYFGYKFDDRFLFNSEIEYEHAVAGDGEPGEVEIEFAYVDFKPKRSFGARAGLLLVPVGFLNELHEPPIFFGAQRPEVEQVIIPTTWREVGIGAYGEAGPVSWKAYLVTGLDASGFSAAEGIREGRQEGADAVAEDLAITARVDWVPKAGLLLGAALFTGDSAQGTPGVGPARVTQWEAHAEWRFKGLQMRGLFVRTRLDDAADVGALTGEVIGSQMNGYYGEVGWNVLSRLPGTRQELSPFFRYEALDTQAEVPSSAAADPANDRMVRTFGLHYRPIPNIAVKADFQDLGDAAGSAIDRFNLAVGWLF